MGFCNVCKVYVATDKTSCSSGHPVDEKASFVPNPPYNIAQPSTRLSRTEAAVALHPENPATAAARGPALAMLAEPVPWHRRPRVRKLGVLGMACVLLALAIGAGVARLIAGDGGVRLTRHFRAGEAHPYTLSSSTSVSRSGVGPSRSDTIWIRLQGDEKTVVVNPDGVANISYTVGSVAAKRNGKTITLPKPESMAVEARIARVGAVTDTPRLVGDFTFGDRLPGRLMTPANLVPFTIPERIEPGSTWTHTLLEQIPMLGERQTYVTYRYRYAPGKPGAHTYALRATSSTPLKLELSPGELSDIVGHDVGLATGRYEGTITTTTDYTILRSTGRVTHADARISGTIKVAFGGGPARVVTLSLRGHAVYQA